MAFLQALSNADLDRMEAESAEGSVDGAPSSTSRISLDTDAYSTLNDNLSRYVFDRYRSFRDTRETRGITNRMVAALRAFRGEYNPSKLAAIRRFGGSEVYGRLVALKCRGATAMLRDVYLGGDRPWFIKPTPVPDLPDNIEDSIMRLAQIEALSSAQAGIPIPPEQIVSRMDDLRKQARLAAKKKAHDEAKNTTIEIEDVLVEGRYYSALRSFLLYLTIFPYADIKGPVVERTRSVNWVRDPMTGEKHAEITEGPRMRWYAPNPFDIYWQSGIDAFEDGEVAEVQRFSRSQLQSVIGVPGFDDANVREVLAQQEVGSLPELIDSSTSERFMLEGREDPHINRSNMIGALEYQGAVPGKYLEEWGVAGADASTDQHATVWMIGNRVCKAVLNPDPRKRHNHFMTSYERIPGAVIGQALPEILEDIENMSNAALRALNNNMGIASGPQVVINDDLHHSMDEGDELYPWKRWHIEGTPFGNSTTKPIDFYQPDSRAQELLNVYKELSLLADEISAIPRYMTGSEQLGSAGRTASGLSMLMNAAGKVLQSVAANIDQEVIGPSLEHLYSMLLLTDKEQKFRGDDKLMVRGVTFATRREAERTRLLEALQLTGNPIDMGIIGQEGRANMLREVIDRIGLDHEKIVPDEADLQAQPPIMPPEGDPSAPATSPQPQVAPPGGMPTMTQIPTPGAGERGNVDEGQRNESRGPSGKAA